MNNFDVYNNNSGSSLKDAYARLNKIKADSNNEIEQQQVQQEKQKSEGNWFTRFIGTLDEFRYNLESGFFNFVEGTIDSALSVGAIFNQEWAEEAIKYDISDKIMDFRNNYLSENAIYKSITGNNLYDQSFLSDADEKVQEIATGIEQGVGQMLGNIGLYFLNPVASITATGLSAAGSKIEETISEEDYTGDFGKAALYGATSGILEAGIEGLSNVAGNLLNGLAKKTGIKLFENSVGFLTGNLEGNTLGKNVVTMISQAVSEGGEELVSELADPLIRTIYSGENIIESYKNNLSKDDLDMAFITGLGTSLVFGGANLTTNSIAYGYDSEGVSNMENVNEARKTLLDLQYMDNNQNEYSENEYQTKKSELLLKLANIGRKISGTKSKRAAKNITNQIVKDINSVKSGTTNKIGINGELTNDDINLLSDEFQFDTDTVNRLNNAKKALNTDINVEFLASDEELKTPDGEYNVNAKYDKDSNTITFSKKISPNVAFNKLISHELYHYFKTKVELKSVENDIIDYLKKTNQYVKRREELEEKYSKDEIHEEMIADFIGELFYKGRDFSKMFTTKSKTQKIIDHLKNIRKNSTDEYIRARYADAISKLVNAKEFKQEGVKYSIAETKYKELSAEKATAELKEGKVYNRNVGEVIYKVLTDEFETNHFRFDVTKEDVLKEVSKLLNLNDVESVEFNEKLENFTKDLVKTIKIGEVVEKQKLDDKGNVIENEKVKYKPILEYFRETDSSTTYSDIYEFIGYDIVDALKNVSVFKGRVSQTTRKNLEIKKSKEIIAMQENLLKEVSEILDNKMTLIQELKKNNIKAIKYVSQIERIKTYAKNFKDSKIFKDGSIKQLAQAYYNKIKSINVTKANARNIVLEIKSAFDSPLIKGDKEIVNGIETYPNDVMKAEQRNYLDTVFKLLDARKGLDQPIDFSNNIENLDEFNVDFKAIQNKTEGEVIADVLRIFRRTTYEANNEKAILNGKEVDIHKVLNKEVELQNANKRNTTKKQEGFVKKIKQIITSIFDPQSWFNVLANNNKDSIFNQIYEELYAGDEEKLKLRYKLQKDLNDYINKNKSLIKKISNKNNKVEIVNDKKIPLIHAIDMYMATQADNAFSHLFNKDFGGFKSGTIHITSKDLISMLEQQNQDVLNKPLKDITEEEKNKIVEDIVGKLKGIVGNDVIELVKTIEKGYNRTGDIYSEIAFKLYGFRYIVQDYYYPLTANQDQFNKQTGTLETNNNFVNNVMQPSFTKQIVSNAGNEINLESAIDRYYNFTNRLSSWAALSGRIKTIDRFLNSHIKTPNNRIQSMREYIKEFIDPDFTKRYNDLVMSMQDIPVSPQSGADRFFNKLRGLMASATLSFKVKTILIQTTAYLKFLQYGYVGNFIKAFGRNKNLISFKDLLKDSPLVYDRYYGNQGRNLAEAHTVGASGSLNRFGQFGMQGMQEFDKIALIWGWRKTQLDAQTMGITDKTEVIKLFERRVNETQASHSALNNGSATRVNNEFVKSTLIFSSENRKTLSRFFESIYKISKDPKNKQYWGEFAGVTTAMLSSSAVIALIASALKSLKGDDEEEEFIEKWGEEFTSNMVGMFPIVSNIYNKLVNGYNIEIAGLSQLEDLLDIPKYCEQLMATNATKADKTSAVMQIAQRLAHIVGVPFKNLYEDLLILAGLGDKVFKTNIVMELRNFYYNTNQSTMSTLMKTYAKRGDENKLKAMVGARFEKYVAGEISEDASKEIARLYMGGHITTMPSSINAEMTYNGQTYTLTKAQLTNAKDVYSLANDLLSDMIGSSDYANLTDEEKAKAIKKLYSTYYELAKSSVIDNYETSKLTQIANYFDISTYVVALSKISNIEQTEKLSRKTAVMQYINKLKLNKNQKYLLLLLAGYSVSEENIESLLKYLKTNGMSSKEADSFLGLTK